MPYKGAVYSKTSAGVMYKITDDTDAQVNKNHDGATEFPVWRVHEELGYGILNNLEAYAKFGYTHDGDIDRKGMHLGRAGLKYRAINTYSGWVWDLYADAQLGGISEMSGSYAANGFTYDNYSNGRWGFHVGTQVGKVWHKFSTAGFIEVLRTFGNDNNSIEIKEIDASKAGFGVLDRAMLTALGFTDEISVDLKSTTEVNAGLKAFYQLDDRWSFGGGFTFKHHADNGVEGLATTLNAPSIPVIPVAGVPVPATMVQQGLVDGLLAEVADMNDGFDEYIISLSAAYQMTDAMQVAVYGEYTFDDANTQSQNGTDVKAEAGVRLNVLF